MRMMTKGSRDCKTEVGGEPEKGGGKLGPLRSPKAKWTRLS